MRLVSFLQWQVAELIKIVVQTADFNLNDELAAMRAQRKDIGAIVNFVGYVRDQNLSDEIATLTLEHYPEMTEKALQKIAQAAQNKWPVQAATIIHRVGTLAPADQIVMVAVASQHRAAAFEACAYMMDYLKTEAPFWKKEHTETGERWVESRQSDDDARIRWDAS